VGATLNGMPWPPLFDPEPLPPALRGLLAAAAPWEILAALDDFVADVTTDHAGTIHPTAVLEGAVRLERGAWIGPHAFVQGPCLIMAGAEVGHAALLRGGVVLGPGAKVGHASEVKRSLLLPHAKAPHFNYVGDSVLGSDVNLGAGVKLANLRLIPGAIRVAGTATGLRKLGAILGDRVSIGCNSVLAPGTVIGRDTLVVDSVSVAGVIPAGQLLGRNGSFTPRRDLPTTAIGAP
jgi:bifunctional N-acetylglucosamine-1-phosphate-uridyltransferase/glucosamine-1-phosphate-acetyltransferase GlmU-like protein